MTRTRVRFKMHPDFPAAATTSPEVVKVAKRAADEIAITAERLAPKGETFDLSGSITVERARSRVISTRGAVAWRVIAADFKAGWHEFGTAKMAAHPFLRPAAKAHALVSRVVEREATPG